MACFILKFILMFYSPYYAVACNKFAGHISALLRLWGAQLPSKKCRSDSETLAKSVSNLTGPRIDPQTSSSGDRLSSSNAFVSQVGGLRFKSRTGQIRHGVCQRLAHPCDIFLKEDVLRGRNESEMVSSVNSCMCDAPFMMSPLC